MIARTSSFAFKGQQIEVAEIAKRLNVAHVLEGSVRTSGDKLRITVQLIRAADSTHMWSQKYDRPLDDIFAVQDEIANAIVQALRIRLLGAAVSSREGGTENFEAYQLYLQAVNAFNLATPESLDSAEKQLKQAIMLDPITVGLVPARGLRSEVDHSNKPASKPTKRPACTERALQLSPQLATRTLCCRSCSFRPTRTGRSGIRGRKALALDRRTGSPLRSWLVREHPRPL